MRDWDAEGGLWEVKDLRMKSIKWKTVSLTQQWQRHRESVHHIKPRQECVPAHSPRLCDSAWEKGCGLYCSRVAGRQSISLSPIFQGGLSTAGAVSQLENQKDTDDNQYVRLLAFTSRIHWMQPDCETLTTPPGDYRSKWLHSAEAAGEEVHKVYVKSLVWWRERS